MSYDTYIVDSSPLTALSAAVRAIVLPVGSILAWAKSFTGVSTIPDGYLECDGSTVSDVDSPLNGQAIPNLNSTPSFLRGNSTSGGTGGSATHNHVTNSADSETNSASGAQTGSATGHQHTFDAQSNNPPYYEVVYIIRIK